MAHSVRSVPMMPGGFFDWILSSRKTDALERPLGQCLEPLQRQRGARAASGPDDGVDLVDDDHPRGAEHLAAAFRGEQEVKRLGSRDQEVPAAASGIAARSG